jgi:deoxyribodipyrimidine photo-lyase
MHLKHGRKMYRFKGLSRQPVLKPQHQVEKFTAWCTGNTGHDFIDAGMRELISTSYVSNRMRQNLASYLIHDLACDWRAGAAWFESKLIDYDVYSNQGNWLYLSGHGTDPRGVRRFNPDKQAKDYDPEGVYRAMWLSCTF